MFKDTVYIQDNLLKPKSFHSTVVRTLKHLVPPNKINIFSLDQAEESTDPEPIPHFIPLNNLY